MTELFSELSIFKQQWIRQALAALADRHRLAKQLDVDAAWLQDFLTTKIAGVDDHILEIVPPSFGATSDIDLSVPAGQAGDAIPIAFGPDGKFRIASARRGSGTQQLMIFGGRADHGEDYAETARRELGEESGLWLEFAKNPTDLEKLHYVGKFDAEDSRGPMESTVLTALFLVDDLTQLPTPTAADDALPDSAAWRLAERLLQEGMYAAQTKHLARTLQWIDGFARATFAKNPDPRFEQIQKEVARLQPLIDRALGPAQIALRVAERGPRRGELLVYSRTSDPTHFSLPHGEQWELEMEIENYLDVNDILHPSSERCMLVEPHGGEPSPHWVYVSDVLAAPRLRYSDDVAVLRTEIERLDAQPLYAKHWQTLLGSQDQGFNWNHGELRVPALDAYMNRRKRTRDNADWGMPGRNIRNIIGRFFLSPEFLSTSAETITRVADGRGSQDDSQSLAATLLKFLNRDTEHTTHGGEGQLLLERLDNPGTRNQTVQELASVAVVAAATRGETIVGHPLTAPIRDHHLRTLVQNVDLEARKRELDRRFATHTVRALAGWVVDTGLSKRDLAAMTQIDNENAAAELFPIVEDVIHRNSADDPDLLDALQRMKSGDGSVVPNVFARELATAIVELYANQQTTERTL